MPSKKVIIRPYRLKIEEWLDAGGRQHHVEPPPDAAMGPFWQTFEEDNTEVFSLVRDGIRYFNTSNNILPEYFNIYHISIDKVGVRMDAKCSELANGEELVAYYQMKYHWEK